MAVEMEKRNHMALVPSERQKGEQHSDYSTMETLDIRRRIADSFSKRMVESIKFNGSPDSDFDLAFFGLLY
jgi:hypothetical protein